MRASVPPAKRSKPTTSHECAALRVLTNRELFLLLPQWMDGWPTRLLQKWRAIAAESAAANATRTRNGFTLSKERQVELFMRALLLAGDVETLQLAVKCTWGRDDSDDKDNSTKETHKKKKKTTPPLPRRSFPVKDLQFAIRSCDTATTRWAFAFVRVQHADVYTFDKSEWYWREAMTHFPGHCGLLDVLHEFVSAPRDLWLRYDNLIEHVEAARWFAAHYGAASVPPSTIVLAARRGDLALVQFLVDLPGQDVAHAVSSDEDVRAFLLTRSAAAE